MSRSTSSSRDLKIPRRMTLRVKMPNQISIWLSQLAWVGVKVRCSRFCLATHARVFLLLCEEPLSAMM